MKAHNILLFFTDKKTRFQILAARGFYRNVPDREYLKKWYKIRTGSELELENPKLFNEKMQWLKLYDRKPIYTTMVDKYDVKKYVADIIGEKYIIPAYGVWNDFEDIDFDLLPQQFVIKCTHGSGGMVICRNKSEFDYQNAKKVINKALKRNYYDLGREWPYKNVTPRILVEKYISNDKTDMMDHSSLNVYKFFTFNGKPEIIQVIQNDKTSDESIDYFDVHWNLLDLRQNFPNSTKHLPAPKHLNEMIELAKVLSRGHSFLRVDLYDTLDGVFFSEFTFYSDNGTAEFCPESWNEILGDKIVLGSIKNIYVNEK